MTFELYSHQRKVLDSLLYEANTLRQRSRVVVSHDQVGLGLRTTFAVAASRLGGFTRICAPKSLHRCWLSDMEVAGCDSKEFEFVTPQGLQHHNYRQALLIVDYMQRGTAKATNEAIVDAATNSTHVWVLTHNRLPRLDEASRLIHVLVDLNTILKEK